MLLESAKRAGIHVDVMQCSGYFGKPTTLKRYLEALPEADIVLCTDAYDVLYAQGEEEILSRFKELNVPLVFGGEKSCYHHFPDVKEYFEQSAGEGIYKYLNSGLIIGYAGAFVAMLDEILTYRLLELKEEFKKATGTVGFFNDQTIYGRYACLHPGKLTLDTMGSLFWTLTEEKYQIKKYAKITARGVFNLEANVNPCIIHISHIDKFYPVYLYAAFKLDIFLTSKNVDLELFYRHLKGNIPYKDSVAVSDEVKYTLKKLSMYKILPLVILVKNVYRWLRAKVRKLI